jgi:hypothetical protein
VDKKVIKQMALDASKKYDLDKHECYRFFCYLNELLINLICLRDITFSIPGLFRTEFTKKGKQVTTLGQRERSMKQKDYATRAY